MVLAIMAGFIAGLVHVLSGPDHLAAVAPLAANKTSGWRTGLQWGLGHCAGVLLIGVLALLFREIVPLDFISSSAETFVGLMLIGIGAWGICKGLTGCTHVPTKAAFAVGTVHGLAGSSHLLGVLPALLFPTLAAVCGYFIGFAAGTIAAMAAFSRLIAAVPQRFNRGVIFLSSCAAVVVGCYWLTA